MSVLFEVANHVATVTIDRPEVMNAVDLPTEAELVRIWTEIEGRDDIRVVVLTGAGERAFCAGADLKNTPNLKGVDYWAAARPGGFGGIALRETLDVPVIARVNGFALGGGLEMLRGSQLRPARAAGRAPAAGRRHAAAAAADPVSPGHGHDADRAANQGAARARDRAHQRGRAARRAR